jgi:YHS domain-containing protein
MRLPRALLLAGTAGAIISACSPLISENPGQGLSPVNAVSEGEDKHLMLAGHDVVSYFTEKTHRPGSAAIRSVYKGVTFRFSRPAHKALFDAAPEAYIPQFGGYCANGIVYGVPWGGEADIWKIIDGKLYIFAAREAHDAFMLDVPRNLALAHKSWNEEVNGSNPLVQRTRRIIFRVPHWKTSAELADEVARSRK